MVVVVVVVVFVVVVRVYVLYLCNIGTICNAETHTQIRKSSPKNLHKVSTPFSVIY